MIIFSERTSLRTWSKEPSRGESETGVSSYTESLYWPATVPAASCLPEGEVLSSIQHMLPEQWIPYEIPGRTLSEITDDTLCVQWLQGREPVYAQETVLCSRYSGKSYRKMLVCSRTGASITEAERLFLSERIDQKIQKRTILPSYSYIRHRSDHGREKRPCIATSMPVYFEPNAAICLVPVETCKTKRTKMMSPRPPRKRF